VRKKDFHELRAMKHPPEVCEQVCLCALQLLAGHMEGIPVKRNGSPKDFNWVGCQAMLASSKLVEHILQLPDHIDNGTLSADRMVACQQQLQCIPGDTDSEKIHMVARASTACCGLLRYLLCVAKYYDSMADLSKRFGGVAIKELVSRC